ncbi:fibronectin type III domain-containing protein [Flavobacterium psychrophilum]|uniref:fibronectin type III domain-containing protein n=1 Tax=Flavobacterium psychrophilum TaxID=96345 RepID=UPI00106CF8D8|nr:fibronectin type III domain-containing protein [Flavobacterium psychrophilum]
MIRNLYKIVFLFLSFQIFGQVYPVQITPIFNTPYSSRISDYATSMDVKMQLLINPSDISITNRQVRLKMYLQGNNINAQSVDYVNGINPIYINGGELLTLTNLDLAALFRLENLQGITPVQYANALPEGMYNVCFELYDFATNQRISQKSCAYLYLMLNDPPLLNTPAKNESIAVSDFPNILFTWTPRQLNATNVSYEFEIKEILDPTIDPQIGFLTSPTLYDETLYSTALLYDSSKPNLLAGKRYAWRVRAMSTSGLSLNNVFKNDGYSEIHHFTYASNCPAPTFILSEALSARSVRISWQGDNSHTKYHLQYKKANVSRAEWFEVYTMNTQTTLTDLEAGVTYEFRVGGSCEPAVLGNRASFTYSGINNFTLPAVGTTSSSFTCGLNPAVAIANQTPITNLIVTETFTAGDFPVKILELTGNNPYNGKGYIIVPYLADTKIAVVFNNITINTNYQLINGIVETSYNPQAPNINDLEDLTGGNNGVIITQTISFVITTVTTNPNGDIIVSGANGEQIAIPGGSNTVITGTTATGGTGSIYNVDSQGNVTGPFMPAPGGATTPQNTDGVATNGQTTQFAAQGLTIAFEPTTATKYSWDIVPDTAPTYIKDKYAKIGSAYLPYKAVVNGQSDVLKTKITLADATIVLDSIVFKTQHGVLLDKVKQGNDYMLTLKGTQTYGEEEVQAVIKQGGKYKVAGAFRLVHVSEKTLNITLVPLNNTTSIPNNAIRNLQTNYEKAGVKLTIKTAPVLMYDGEADAKITTSDSGVFDYYTDEEKSINAKIKALPEYNNKTYYLIYSNLPSDKGIEGFMALGGQFGYVFPNASSKTAPHELAHGVFALQHPFANDGDKGKTPYLMDYGSGTELWHNDWAQINNPALKFYGFQSSGDGELTNGYWYMPNWVAFTGKKEYVPVVEVSSSERPQGTVRKIKKSGTEEIYVYAENDYYFNGKPLGIDKPTINNTLEGYLFYSDGICGNSIAYTNTNTNIQQKKDFDLLKSTSIYKYMFNCLSSNYDNLSQLGKDIYDKNKLTIPETDRTILLEISSIGEKLGTDLYNSFAYKLKNDGNLFWNNTNSSSYSLEGLKQTLEKIKSFNEAYQRLKYKTYTLEELVTEFRTNFQVTKGSDNIFVFPSDPKFVQIIKNPFLGISIEQKKKLLDLLSNAQFKTLQNVGDDVNEGHILCAIFETLLKSPEQEQKILIDYIDNKKYLKHFVENVYGFQYDSFMSSLFSLVRKNYESPSLSVNIDSPNYLAFSSSLLQLNSENFNSNGKIILEVKRWFGDNRYTITKSPYDYVTVEFEKQTSFGTALTFPKGAKVKMPMIWAYQLFWKDTKAGRWTSAKIAVDVALTVCGVGEIGMALKAIRSGRTVYGGAMALKAVGDLGFGLTDIYLNASNNSLTETQLKKWNTFYTLWAMGSISATALDNLATRLGKKSIDNADDFAKFEQEFSDAEIERLKSESNCTGCFDEVVQNGNNLISKLDNPLFSNLKEKYNQLDNVLKSQFETDFANVSDELLSKLQNDNLFEVWKNDIRSNNIDELILYKSKGNLRNDYLQTIDGLKQEAQSLLLQNTPKVEIAETMCNRRRQITTDFKGATPDDLLEWIFKFNDKRYTSLGYGDKWGQTWEGAKKLQLDRGITGDAAYDAIIKGSSSGLGTKEQLGSVLKGTLKPILSEQEFTRLTSALDKYRMNP